MSRMNWDRVNMENLAARRKAEHDKKGGDHPMTNRSSARKSSYFRKNDSKTLKPDARSLLKIPKVSSLDTKRCEHCGIPVKTKSIKKHFGRVHSFVTRVIDALSIRKRSKTADPHVCVKKQQNPETLKATVGSETIAFSPKISVDHVAGEKNTGPKTLKKKLKAKKQKGGPLADVLYSRNNEQLAQTIATRLRNMECDVRLIQTARRERAGARSGKITCYSRSPETIALAEKLIVEFSGTIDLNPEYERTRRKGGITFTVRVCG